MIGLVVALSAACVVLSALLAVAMRAADRASGSADATARELARLRADVMAGLTECEAVLVRTAKPAALVPTGSAELLMRAQYVAPDAERRHRARREAEAEWDAEAQRLADRRAARAGG
jgi:hypothetical protein